MPCFTALCWHRCQLVRCNVLQTDIVWHCVLQESAHHHRSAMPVSQRLLLISMTAQQQDCAQQQLVSVQHPKLQDQRALQAMVRSTLCQATTCLGSACMHHSFALLSNGYCPAISASSQFCFLLCICCRINCKLRDCTRVGLACCLLSSCLS